MARNASMPPRLAAQAARKAVSFRVFGEVVSELRRVTWPTRQETMRLTMMVLAVAAAVGTFLGIIDIAFTHLLNAILGT